MHGHERLGGDGITEMTSSLESLVIEGHGLARGERLDRLLCRLLEIG
jgi:hypothetical protein